MLLEVLTQVGLVAAREEQPLLEAETAETAETLYTVLTLVLLP
jgi:hypothetical protein